MTSILTSGAKIYSLIADRELLEALHKIATLPGLLKKEITDGKSLVDFLSDGGSKFKDPAIKTAIGLIDPAVTAPNGPYDKVVAQLDRLIGGVGNIADKPVARLLNRIDRFPDASDTEQDQRDAINWVILDQGVNIDGSTPKVTFGLSAQVSAQVDIEASDRWPYERDIAADNELASLVRLSATGGLKAAASATVPFSIGKLTLGANASADTKLSYYYRYNDGSTLFAKAVAQGIADLRNPLDFDDVWKGLTTSNLKGVVLSLDGAFEFGATVAAAAAAEIVDGISASVGLTISAKVARAATFNLSLRAIGATGNPGDTSRKVMVVLSKSASRSSTLGADLGITIDATELAARVGAAVEAELGKWDDRLAKIRPLLNPGTYLRDLVAGELSARIAGFVGDPGLGKALVADMKSALGLTEPSAHAADWLKEKVAAAITRHTAELRTAPAVAVNKIYAAVEPLIPVTLQSATAAQVTAIKKMITDAIGQYTNAVTAAATELYNVERDSIKQLLASIGVAIDGVVTDVDDAFAAVRALFDRYDAIIAKIRSAIELAAKAKLQAAFTYETSSTSANDVLITGTFDRGSNEASKVYELILAGKFDALIALLDAASPSATGFTLDRANSWLARSAAWKSKSGFRLVVFGKAISSTSLLLSSEALVRVDGNGDVEVTTNSEAEAEKKSNQGVQTLKFSSGYSLAYQKQTKAIERHFSAKLTIARDMKDLTLGALDSLLGDLSKRGLLSSTAPADARRVLNEWLGNIHGDASKLPATIRIGLNLGQDQMLRLVRLADRSQGSLPVAARIETIDAVLQELKATGALKQSDEDTAADIVRSAIGPSPTDAGSVGALYYRYTLKKFGPDFGKLNSFETRAVENMRVYVGGWRPDGSGEGASKNAWQGTALRFVDALDALADTWEASPVGPNSWDAAAYRDAGKRIARGMAVWLRPSGGGAKDFNTLRPELVAGLLVIAELSGQALSGPNATGAGLLYLEMSKTPAVDEEPKVTLIV